MTISDSSSNNFYSPTTPKHNSNHA